MFDYIAANFNWFTFWLALGAFVLISNIIGLITATITHKRAKKRLAESESKYEELKSKLAAKQAEHDRVLGKKEQK